MSEADTLNESRHLEQGAQIVIGLIEETLEYLAQRNPPEPKPAPVSKPVGDKGLESMFNSINEEKEAHQKVEDMLSGRKPEDIAIKVEYKNWRGEVGIRTIIPLDMSYGPIEYHKEEQWLLRVWDVDKNNFRMYALGDIQRWIYEKENQQDGSKGVSDGLLHKILQARPTKENKTPGDEIQNSSEGTQKEIL